MEDFQKEIQKLTQDTFDSLLGWMINDERERRKNLEAVSHAQATVIAELRESGAIEAPKSVDSPSEVSEFTNWVNPGTVHSKMYLLGDIVQHNGKVWKSMVNGLNSWEPGAQGVYDTIWAEITHEVLPVDAGDTTAPVADDISVGDSPAGFKAPTGAHDAYAKGARVTFEGKVYESLIDANVYSPSAYPAGWKLIG